MRIDFIVPKRNVFAEVAEMLDLKGVHEAEGM